MTRPNALKAVAQTDTELRVGNYIVLFGGRDLTGEFFTKSTNFQSNFTDLGVLYVDFEHGRDAERAGNSPSNVLGIVDWKSARMDEVGIFVERVLNRRAEYMKYLSQLIEQGIMGTSSEAVPGGPRKKSGGEIVEWPLMRDSLTVTPMEPRMVDINILSAAKALSSVFPHSRSLAILAGAPVPVTKSTRPRTIRDFESALHALGYSGREAKRMSSSAWSALMRNDDSAEVQEIASLFRKATNEFNSH